MSSSRRRTQRWIRAVASATVLVAVIAAGVVGTGSASARGPSTVPAAAKPTRGGSVNYGIESETSGGWCLPNAQLAISGIMVASAIYDTLTEMNSKGKYVPYLAKTVTHDPTYTQWTIGLRDGVKFQDGTPLTADAVKQNVDAWKKGRLLGFVYSDVADVAVVDPLTVKVTTAKPWVDFDAFLFFDGRVGIAAPAQLANADTCPTNLIGTGPFMIYNGAGHWTPNQEFVASRNPNYWRTDRFGTQLPYLDKIVFRPNPDPSQRTNQLQAGQLQLTHTWSGLQIDQLQRLSGLTLMRQKPGRREVRYYVLNAKKPPFDDLNARKAIALALDRPQINAIRNAGIFQLANGPFDKDVPGYLKNPGFPRHNLNAAQKLVAAYKSAHGGQFSVVVEYTNDPEDSGEGQLMKEQLAKAGIASTLQIENQSAFINTALGGNFSILLWRNHPGDDPDVNYVWWNASSPINFGKFQSPNLQTLLDQGRSEPDPAKRKQIYEQINKIFSQQYFNIWSYYADWTIAAKPNLQGLAGPPLPDGGGQPIFVYGRHPVVGIWLKK
ncbi:MAG TPA: ABC transporter substrate-binding protein [Acidimicrobiia bacterium]